MTQRPQASDLRISHLGISALLCEVPPPLTLEWQRRLWSLAARLEEIPVVSEVVPGMNNLMIVFDPLRESAGDLSRQIERLWLDCESASLRSQTRELPVVYGGTAGMDLEEVARHAGISAKEAVRLHSEGDYTVFFLGAYPGLGFLGGLHPALATPRRREPRLRVPAGSVAIGGIQTGALPATMPSGWNVIGNTSAVLFDISRDPPALLAPGDRVRFVVERIDT